jgi:hypothetical protein
MKLKSLILTSLLTLNTAAIAAPHFFMQMENRGDKDATISFRHGTGEISLDPVLPDNTTLPAHSASNKYGVIVDFKPDSTFVIAFKGKEECTFTAGFGSPGFPKVTIEGRGCDGAGFGLNHDNKTLVFYVNGINLKK